MHVIDDYTHIIAQHQHPHRHRFVGFLCRSACLVIKLKLCHDIASKMQDIRQIVRDINPKSVDFGFNSTLQQGSTFSGQTNIWYDPCKDSCFRNETEVMVLNLLKIN